MQLNLKKKLRMSLLYSAMNLSTVLFKRSTNSKNKRNFQFLKSRHLLGELLNLRSLIPKFSTPTKNVDTWKVLSGWVSDSPTRLRLYVSVMITCQRNTTIVFSIAPETLRKSSHRSILQLNGQQNLLNHQVLLFMKKALR